MANAVYRERVEEGSKYLDMVYPKWFEKIDVEILDLGNHWMCCLGQLYGSYGHAVRKLSLSPDENVAYAFAICPEDADEVTAAWRREIQLKRTVERVCHG